MHIRFVNVKNAAPGLNAGNSQIRGNMIKKLQKTAIMMVVLGILLFISGFTVSPADACKIRITVNGNEKTTYTPGDELVLKVSVFLTHRNCPEGIDATRFRTSNLEVLGATDWSERSGNHFERLITVKIFPSETGEAIIMAERDCTKVGGGASLVFKVTS